MLTIHLVLLVLALICFIVATFNYPTKVNMVALGLALWVLTLILGR